MTDDNYQHECYRLITDLWKTLKPLTTVKNTNEYWDEALEKFAGLREMYENTVVAGLAHDMSVACVNALQRRAQDA